MLNKEELDNREIVTLAVGGRYNLTDQIVSPEFVLRTLNRFERALGMLKECEWIKLGGRCPGCSGFKPELQYSGLLAEEEGGHIGHADGCRFAAMLEGK